MRTMIQILVAVLMALTVLSVHAERRPHLVLAGPLAAVSFPLIHMVESGTLADLAETVEFVSWRIPINCVYLHSRTRLMYLPCRPTSRQTCTTAVLTLS